MKEVNNMERKYFRMSDGSNICLNDLLVPIRTRGPIADKYELQANYLADDLNGASNTQAQEITHELRRLGMAKHKSVNPRGRLWQTAFPILNPDRLSNIQNWLRPELPEVNRYAASAMGYWGGEVEAKELYKRLEAEGSIEEKHSYLSALVNLGGKYSAKGIVWALNQEDWFLAMKAISSADDLITGGSSDVTEAVDRDYGRRVLKRYKRLVSVKTVEKALRDLGGNKANMADWTLELFKSRI